MARVVKGFMFGTRYGLTFYMMDGNLYVRLKSTLSRKKVKYSERFQRTMQSAGELGRASKVAARVYRELSREQRKIVSVLYKKMTGVAKMAFKDGKSEEEAEREVREYLVAMGVVKPEVAVVEQKEKAVLLKVKPMVVKRKVVRVRALPRLFVRHDGASRKERMERRIKKVEGKFTSINGPPFMSRSVPLFDG